MGSSKGGETGTSTLRTASSLTRQQKRIASQLERFLTGSLGREGEAFPGELTAPLIPELEAARGLLGQVPGELGEFDDLTRAAITKALGGEPSYKLDPEATRERFRKSVAAPLLRTFDEEISPRISQGFGSQGALFSSRRGQAQRGALEGLQTQMAGKLSDWAYQDQVLKAQLAESTVERQLGAIGLGRDYTFRDISRANALSAAASPFQQFEQQRMDRDYQEWLRRRPENAPQISQALNFLGQPHMQSWIDVAPPPQRTNWEGLLGAGLGIGLLKGAI